MSKMDETAGQPWPEGVTVIYMAELVQDRAPVQLSACATPPTHTSVAVDVDGEERQAEILARQKRVARLAGWKS